MSWSERQRRMLAAMGVRLWSPAASAPPAVAAAAVAEAAAEATVAERVVEAPATPPVAQQPPRATAPAAPPVRAPAPAPARATTIAAAAASVQETIADTALAERAAHIATLAWGPLQDAVAACTACGLCESRRQTVFGVGHAQADWMIVGEAPGEQEDLQGEPFVGPAGQLLDQMLRAVGQSRRTDAGEGREDDQAGDPARRVFIANTLKCRPPRNRNPEPDELARCEPFLKRQLALVQPKLILVMGRFAVKQLLKSDEAIGKLRGRVHRYEGIPVIVTYHPAYLLRNMPDKAKAWEDLCLAKATADAP
ncbi:uracil-DNA glycosylase [Scleromatobacter humisilvae]|uniref:Uracil-DNA glycosylase n=1 Tax=Scleromatobacter humisilvae TaxID=2897159 RepID=A0A9X2BYK2_9BURK|nr:uracil-DNA glycosylase [Scleromatobacter humisilvae]MCK9685487.1 uracil-DNA glycosylase [Scleromatobacter humisilvae]